MSGQYKGVKNYIKKIKNARNAGTHITFSVINANVKLLLALVFASFVLIRK